MTDQTTSAGWYPDNQGTLRWFDGSQWTEPLTHLPKPLSRLLELW